MPPSHFDWYTESVAYIDIFRMGWSGIVSFEGELIVYRQITIIVKFLVCCDRIEKDPLKCDAAVELVQSSSHCIKGSDTDYPPILACEACPFVMIRREDCWIQTFQVDDTRASTTSIVAWES